MALGHRIYYLRDIASHLLDCCFLAVGCDIHGEGHTRKKSARQADI
jgi:hypothetical protein